MINHLKKIYKRCLNNLNYMTYKNHNIFMVDIHKQRSYYQYLLIIILNYIIVVKMIHLCKYKVI